MTSNVRETQPAVSDERQRDLRAELQFDLSETGCPIAHHDEEALLDHHVHGDTCYVVSCCEDDDGVTQLETDLSSRERCVCSTFHRHRCVPHFSSVDDGRVVVTTFPADRETLRELIADLREVVGRVSLRRLTRSNSPEFTDVRTADLSLLTAREEEVLSVAIAAGYYDEPRTIEFEALADRLEMSKSALSQRLRSAESKLLIDLLEE
ncbi:bacterio-opsin activator [Halobiforma lacisalsi AJ5]|uniref:Bacterio-opsin activator n=1 Tax=Natronobacterium lacisalsi AJ5 TaxID=358396 RepID=M0LVG5_NATLA|nr:helix-turn-helix domain-containing protein [Halobiforma lacisalsi]APW96288.1 bacterio-opsin activator [Halobiforma lacisalsi AJ5]EMA36364.1 Bacterio-opsin activator HTH domain protein [Halobiforma lacisalsi AJ5]